jgi:hypothetical protein
MRRNHRVINILMVLVIAALTAATAVLAYYSDTFNVGTVTSYAVSAAPASTVSAVLPAAYPEVIAIYGTARYAAAGDSATLDALYRITSVALGEALGTSRETEEIREAEFRAALTQVGIYFDYLYPVPLDSVVAWTGVSSIREHNIQARRFILSPDELGFALLYYEADGRFYKSATIANLGAVLPRLGAYISNSGYFAFEHKISGIDPYCLFFDTVPEIPAITLSHPFFDARTILPLFGMNAYLQAEYSANGFTWLYVEDERQARFLSGGEIKFTRYALTAPAVDRNKAIEIARLQLAPFTAGDELLDLRYSGFEFDGTTYRISFVWYYNEYEICAPGAVIAVDGTGIREADIHLLTASPAGTDYAPLLPAPQAAAAAQYNSPGAELRLAYDEAGTPIWRVVN